MIRDHINNPSGTPVELVCDKTCYVLEGNLWKAQLSEISDGIVFIDEEMNLSKQKSSRERFRKQIIIM